MSDITLPLFSLQLETTEIPLTQGKVALVEVADFDWLMQWKWYAHWQHHERWYVLGYYGGTTVAMHRVILGAKSGQAVDHIDGDGLNNVRSNLRFATDQQNVFNRRPVSGSSSRFKGVTWVKKYNKWQAQIEIKGVNKYLGIFADEVEAARVYDAAAKELFGSFAWLNFRDELP